MLPSVRFSRILFSGIALAVLGFPLFSSSQESRKVIAKDNRVFEMRTYYANPGKIEALHARFRDHTLKLFEKHGITNVGYWKPTDAAKAEEVLVYILAYPSKEAADKSWKGFREDPAWHAARDASEKAGKLVKKADSVYLNPTDYSPLK
ncbi:MAG: NIPSNAP family protein [Gemmataceae bacterium]|nr:NIPSNAP family protein [Gemmataceae bacterium]